MKGRVKWFNSSKGYGFITKDDGTGDVFVHYSSIVTNGFKNLSENDPVDFEIMKGDKGDKAYNVRKLEG